MLDDDLSNGEAADLSEDDLLAVALDVVRQYAMTAARDAEHQPDGQ